MASLDNLPPDQRAVLSLVLERGRGYDEIARMLSIDRTAVRERALAAFDALGPHTQISDLRRALITDYLLGQLPSAVAQETRDRLATNPSERAWARVLASELAPLASKPLPEIPAAAPRADAPVAEPATVAPHAPGGAAGSDEAGREAAAAALGTPSPDPDAPRSSRVGGMILLIGAALVAVAVVLVIVLSSGGSSKGSHSSSSLASGPSATSSAASGAGAPTTTSGAAATTPQVVAQINLLPPSGNGNAAGIAEVLKEGATKGIAIVAQHMAPNTTKPPNAYAVWLYNSAADAKLLGFVNPGVGHNGRLSAASRLPASASHFKKLIVTLETKADPQTPGMIVLSGALTGV